MPRSRNLLSAETLRDIHLSAIHTRHKWDADPVPVIAELRREADDRLDILAAAAGPWAGFTERDEDAQALVGAVMQLELPGLDEAIELGRSRAAQSVHATPPTTH
ncbi:hypothetical protein [Microbacterium marinilacus]|nr:hypothetical protein [Microbacterium marinilacus]MBY0690511.1 hypothetical protein [Microbacterium marinilacus]